MGPGRSPLVPVRREKTLSIVIPTLDGREGRDRWSRYARHRRVREVIVVVPDEVAPGRHPPGVRVIRAPMGRASQMNAGARIARGAHLLFLHGDTEIDADGLEGVAASLDGEPDGAFALSLAFRSEARIYRTLERAAAWRDRMRPFPLGDQGLAVSRTRFHSLGGFPDEPLFEDVVLLRRLRRSGPVGVLAARARTGVERFQRRGVLRTLAANLALVLLQAVGVPPRTLVRWYYGPEYLERWTDAAPGRRTTVAPSGVPAAEAPRPR